MGNKILNTLKHGDSRTRQKLMVMIGLLGLGLVLLLCALLFTNPVLGLVAFAFLFADGLMVLNSSFQKKEITMKKINKEKLQKVQEQKSRKNTAEEPEEEETEQPGALEWISSEKKERPKPEGVSEEAQTSRYVKYTDSHLKKIMVAYKVKREHVLVLVDYCPSERISQCPAYAWKDREYLYFLLLKEEATMIKASLKELSGITIRRNVTARPNIEYEELKENTLIGKLFGELVPSYYQVETELRRVEHKKNMYEVAPGVWCTAASVRNLLKLLPAVFHLEGNKLEGESEYFKDIYCSRVLYYDTVYKGAEYKDKVIGTLTDMATANIADGTFHTYLARMVMQGLIPQEYADYAVSKRAKK